MLQDIGDGVVSHMICACALLYVIPLYVPRYTSTITSRTINQTSRSLHLQAHQRALRGARVLPAGSFTLNKGLQHEEAALVALVRNIDIVIAYVCDVLLLVFP
jgi:hypothetical protein